MAEADESREATVQELETGAGETGKEESKE